MGANYGKLSPAQREKVWTLCKAGKSAAVVSEQLAKGWPNETPPIPPVSVSRQGVNSLHRRQLRERDDLYATTIQHLATPEGIDIMARRLLMIADRESQRLAEQQSRGKLDAQQLGKLAGAIERIHKLSALQPVSPPPGPAVAGEQLRGEATPPTLAEQLIERSGDDQQPAPVADVPVA